MSEIVEAPHEREVVLLLADISGYTKFMVENQTSAVHGQMAITLLLETILAEVDIPLTLHGIEGDAVFFSAAHPGDDEGWRDVLAQVRTKLPRFFEVFLAAIVRAAEITPCDCPACRHVDELKLKIIVHTGRAVFHTIANIPQVSGTDVIIVHRLLKNTVAGGEYLLMTDAAYEHVGRGMHLPFEPGEESYEGIGKIRTWVSLTGAARESARDEFYAQTESELVAEAEDYARSGFPAMCRALLQQLRRPTIPVSWPRRIGFAIRFVVDTMIESRSALAQMRSNVLAKRAARRGSGGDEVIRFGAEATNRGGAPSNLH